MIPESSNRLDNSWMRKLYGEKAYPKDHKSPNPFVHPNLYRNGCLIIKEGNVEHDSQTEEKQPRTA